MWKYSILSAYKKHYLEYVLLILITMLGFYIINLQIEYTGGFDVKHLIMTAFFGVISIVYPITTALKDYHDMTMDERK